MNWGVGSLAQFIGPSAIHAHPLHAAYADQLDAHIIAAISFICKGDKLGGGGFEIGIPLDDLADFRAFDGTVQAVGTKQQDVVHLHLAVVDFNVHEKIVA